MVMDVSCQATLGPGHPHHVEMATVMDVSFQATLGLCPPLCTGDGHSDKEIPPDSPHGKPSVEGDPAEGSCRAMLEQSCLCLVVLLSTSMWIMKDLSIAASLAVKWESSLLITCLTGN